MKKATYITIFLLITGNLCWLGLPWWILSVLGVLAAFLFPVRAGAGAAAGFAAGFLLWYLAAFALNAANGGMLAGKVGQLFLGLQGWQLLVTTGTLGGLLGMFGVLTGVYGRGLAKRKV